MLKTRCKWRLHETRFFFWNIVFNATIFYALIYCSLSSSQTMYKVLHLSQWFDSYLGGVAAVKSKCLFFYSQPFNPLCIQFDKSGVYSSSQSDSKTTEKSTKKLIFLNFFQSYAEFWKRGGILPNLSQMGDPCFSTYFTNVSPRKFQSHSLSLSQHPCMFCCVYTSFAYIDLVLSSILNYLSFDCYMAHWNGSKMTTCTAAINI